MSFTSYFYHGLHKKYVAAFGSLFDQITIERTDEESGRERKFIVPIAYGPWQKFLTKKIQDPEHNRPVAISLPRIAFEVTGMTYDPQRKISSTKKIKLADGQGIYAPVPYMMEFSVSIMGKYVEDVYKIQEQILPFFSPEYTPTLHIIPGMKPLDTPIFINSTSMEDAYEGDYETRRAVIGTMTFTMNVEFYAPIRNRKVIKFVDIDFFDKIETNSDSVSNISSWVFDYDDEAKDYKDVEETDNWGIRTHQISGETGDNSFLTTESDEGDQRILTLNIGDETFIVTGDYDQDA